MSALTATNRAGPEADRLGGLLAPSGRPRRAGALASHYLKTLLPGTLVLGIAAVSMYGGARLTQDVTTGVFDRFRAMSIWRGAHVLGSLIGDAGRYLLAAAIVVILGVIIGYRPDGGAPGVIAAVVLVIAFGLALSWLFAAVNPISHVADASRDLMNSTGGAVGAVGWSLIAIAAITLMFAPVTLHLYSKMD